MKSEFKKDDCVTLHIEDIGTGGEGIGKADGFTFFVKDAIVGDVIEAKIMKLKKNYGYARLMKVLTPVSYTHLHFKGSRCTQPDFI